MQLLELIENKYRIVSVIGMAKNSGKTVALNELIYEAVEKNIHLGITSIGRDGEKQDIVTNTEKPMIYLEEGMIVATAEETFKASEAKLEILEITNYNTSLGKIVISRVITGGYVEIAGPTSNEDIKSVSEKMLAYGARIVIVDGAIDRISSASPAITEATILATGAVLSRDMNKVIEKSAHRVRLLNLDVVKDENIKYIAEDMENSSVSVVNEGHNVTNLKVKTALNSGKDIASALKEDSKYVIIKGSLVSKTLKDIVNSTKYYKNVIFVVKDATKVFIDHKKWMYFERIGVRLKVLEKINVLAVTINPYSPKGYYFSAEEFLKKMKIVLKPTPVLDVMLGGGV